VSTNGDTGIEPEHAYDGPMLSVDDIHVYYGNIAAVKGISIEVKQGEIVTLIGSNGAGKSTTMRAISGLVSPRRGSITFEGRKISGMPGHLVTALGISQSPEGRRIFGRMSVDENLDLGAFLRNDKDGILEDREKIYELFPRLKERIHQKAGTLSGGEQQMLAVARALMTRPRLLMLDEPSLGLAPLVTREVFRVVSDLNRKEGIAVLVVEQNASIALTAAARAYVLETGRVAIAGTADDLKSNDAVRSAYLGY